MTHTLTQEHTMYILIYSECNEQSNEAVSESIEALKLEAEKRTGTTLVWEDNGYGDVIANLEEEYDEVFYQISKIEKV